MLTITLLIIAVSIDAMSFGLAQGLKKIKITFIYIACMSILSTILFSVPLYLSRFIVEYLSEFWLDLVNGIILLALGIYYIAIYFVDLKKQDNLDIYVSKNESITFMKLKPALAATIPISIDAVFTAFLNGYSLSHIGYGIILYFIITFLSILITNQLGLQLSKRSNINLGFLSGLIFIIIGLLKFFGI